MYLNREHAGNLLADACLMSGIDADVVVAIPRGGVPIGAVLSQRLKLPLEIILAKKIGHPDDHEYAIGAVAIDTLLLTRAKSISKAYIDQETKAIQAKIREKQARFNQGRSPIPLSGKKIILVDDGIATGSTLQASILMAKKAGVKEIFVAIPVGPIASISALQRLNIVDKIICLWEPENFNGVGQFYDKFEQVTDQEVAYLLNHDYQNEGRNNPSNKRHSDPHHPST